MRFQKGRAKTGGRQKGAKNKATLAREQALADLVVDTKDPISFFTSIMRDETAPFEKREAAADRLLPYYHPKLASIEARGGGLTHEERLERAREMLIDMESSGLPDQD
jgi:hypothetical protein